MWCYNKMMMAEVTPRSYEFETLRGDTVVSNNHHHCNMLKLVLSLFSVIP